VPLLLLQLAGLAHASVPAETERPNEGALGSLMEHLGRSYPSDHLVSLLNLPAGEGRGSRTTVPLARLSELVPKIASTSHLFIDGLRP
jgi:hypothetical protein